MARYDTDALIEETLSALSGYTMDQGQLTWLTEQLEPAATTMTVNDPANVRRGIAEVGEELVYVAASSDTEVTLAPFGRGYQGTQESTWPMNTRVSFGPRFPRYRVRHTINDVIDGTWPMLFAVASTTVEVSASQSTFELPADLDGDLGVLTVKQRIIGSDSWHNLERFRVNVDADVATGRSLDVLEPINPGPLRVTYTKRPAALATDGTFTDTGLQPSAWPAVKFGALHMLIAPQEAGLSGLDSVRAAEAQRQRAISPVALSKQYYAVYQQLITEERARLLSDTEITHPREEV